MKKFNKMVLLLIILIPVIFLFSKKNVYACSFSGNVSRPCPAPRGVSFPGSCGCDADTGSSCEIYPPCTGGTIVSVSIYSCNGLVDAMSFCPGAGSSCFLPGTKIKTPNGEKNIEEIKKGDKVVSFIPQTPKETIQNTVKEPYSVTRDHFYEIETLSGKIIRATDEHPFYIGFEKQKKTSIEKIKSLFNISYIYFSDGWQEIKERIWR